MFGMSFTEILVIAIIAVLFLGPDKLPDALVKVAKFFRSVKKAVMGAKEALDQEIKIQELKESALSYKEKMQKSVYELEREADLEAFRDIPSKLESIDDILGDEEPQKEDKKGKKQDLKKEANKKEMKEEKKDA